MSFGSGASLGRIFEARLYDRALTPQEAAAASSGTLLEVVTESLLAEAMAPEQKKAVERLDGEIALLEQQLTEVDQEIESTREALNVGGDPYFKIAHAILNSKELIYVY